MWVYIGTEHLWQVGFYDPEGHWQVESVWEDVDEARERVCILNGGSAVPRKVSVVSAVRKALSARELEVLRLVAAGKSNADIGRELFLSEKTVKAHLSYISRKLRANNRTHAAVLGLALGLLTFEELPLRDEFTAQDEAV